MGFMDFLFGSRPDLRFTPGAEQTIQSLQGMQLGLSGPARQAKSLFKQLNMGKDVSSMGQFAPIAQNEAKNLSDVDFDYMTGANALIGSEGGADVNQLNRMRDIAKERVREQAGRERVQALSDLRNQAWNMWQRGSENWDQQEMMRQQLLAQARSPQNMYDARRQGGILPGLIQMGAQLGLGALTGGLSAAGAGAAAGSSMGGFAGSYI